MIYIEFDTVARLVYKFNHDPSFNGDLPDDGIEHIYVDSFEAFVRDFETFMEEHGRKYNTFSKLFFLTILLTLFFVSLLSLRHCYWWSTMHRIYQSEQLPQWYLWQMGQPDDSVWRTD